MSTATLSRGSSTRSITCLIKMQEIFNGYLEEVFSMVTLMESLQEGHSYMWTNVLHIDPSLN